jgi:hypothetical protein
VSYLHEWASTAMFELGTVGSVLTNEMVERRWDVDIFLEFVTITANRKLPYLVLYMT